MINLMAKPVPTIDREATDKELKCIANGLDDNQMVLAQKSNLYFGTGLMNDLNLVKVLDMADLDGSQNARFIMRFTATVQYGYGSEIVLYDPTV